MTEAKSQAQLDQARWVCLSCGDRYGKRMPDFATWHWDTCGVCGQPASCTEPRDFGGLREHLGRGPASHVREQL